MVNWTTTYFFFVKLDIEIEFHLKLDYLMYKLHLKMDCVKNYQVQHATPTKCDIELLIPLDDLNVQVDQVPVTNVENEHLVEPQ